MFGFALFLAISGVALYYLQAWHDWTAILHWAVGLAALAVFLIHWLSKSLPKREDLRQARTRSAGP